MRVPVEWLKQYVDVTATAEEIATRLTMGGLEVEGIEQTPSGAVLDVYVTPNRGDCLSMVGVAREVAALYDLPLRVPSPPVSSPGGAASDQITITVEETALCPRYAARLIRGVRIEPSPRWMQAQLEAVKMRAINNVVDATNYVMLELGQPLHAFDLGRLSQAQIVVRRARPGESITTLDGAERALTPAMLVVADAERPVAVAGIMGGATSEVRKDTTDLLIEAAHFDALSVRRTGRELALRTEASYRFERVVDPDGVRRAVDRCCELLAGMGQTGIVEGIVDVYPSPIAPHRVTLRSRRASALLGMEITPEIAADCLVRLGFKVTLRPDGDILDVEVPPLRPDIRLEEDLIEEVGRIYGYENIPETLPAGATTRGGDSEEGLLIARIKRTLVNFGLQEVVTHSLTAPSFFDAPQDAASRLRTRRIAVRNALSSDVSGLRASLLPTMLDVAQHNAAHGESALALFEVGRVWRMRGDEPVEEIAVAGLITGPAAPPQWQRAGRAIAADYADARGIVEQLLAGLRITGAEFVPISTAAAAEGESGLPQFHPGRTAWVMLPGEAGEGLVGELHPGLAGDLSFRDRIYLFEIPLASLAAAMPTDGIRYHGLAKYPAVTRDLAPRLAQEISYREVELAIRSAATPLLEDFRLTDVFTGPPLPEGTRSLTLSFTLRSPTATLNEGEINDTLAPIRAALEARCGASFAL